MPVGQVTADQLRRGCRAFAKWERRDAMYRVSSVLVKETWGKHPAEVADALGVILLTWNQAFYRYGFPDFDRIEQILRAQQREISIYRENDLLHVSDVYINKAADLFDEFMDATAIRIARTGELRRSPVSAAKALHILAPSTFPLWDQYIRKALGYGDGSKNAAKQYVRFMYACRDALMHLSREQSLEELAQELSRLGRFPKTILKCLDEYFYALHTKHWI